METNQLAELNIVSGVDQKLDFSIQPSKHFFTFTEAPHALKAWTW